jgi:RimJ/RimL family protein N-acetyltransferase
MKMKIGVFPYPDLVNTRVNHRSDFRAGARTASGAYERSMDYFLTSARLGFRCWREDDLPLAIELWSDAEVTALIGGPFKPEQVGIRLAKEIAQVRDFHVQYWPVFLLNGDRFVGCAGLSALSCGPARVRVGISSLPAVLGTRIGERGSPRCH